MSQIETERKLNIVLTISGDIDLLWNVKSDLLDYFQKIHNASINTGSKDLDLFKMETT